MNRKKIRLIYNIIMIVLVLYAWLIMFFNTEESMLTSKGFINLKYFTTLSNIFAAIVAVIWTVNYLNKKDEDKMRIWKLMSASAVGLTFTVVLTFLGPLYGFGTMYVGSNFFLHMLVPLMAMAEFLIFNDKKISIKKNTGVIAAPLIYGTVYLVNTIINGKKGNDIYGFLNWGYPVGILIFGMICIATYLIGLLLIALNNLIYRKSRSINDRNDDAS
ncbi:MAG: hypothetical protein J6X66_06390 [Lachnospiraceae bacterium]|nr:hypothetical protein [Lachnospiraceae bacterium]